MIRILYFGKEEFTDYYWSHREKTTKLVRLTLAQKVSSNIAKFEILPLIACVRRLRISTTMLLNSTILLLQTSCITQLTEVGLPCVQ